MGRKFCRKVTYHPQGNNNKALIHREKNKGSKKDPFSSKRGKSTDSDTSICTQVKCLSVFYMHASSIIYFPKLQRYVHFLFFIVTMG